MSENKISVLGAGSLGLLYAARLAKGSCAVRLLVKPDKAAQLAGGIQYKDRKGKGSARQFISVLSQPTADMRIGRLIIATKSAQAAPALTSWLPQLTADAEVLMLQNGLGSQAQVAQLLTPQQTLLAASVTEGAYREGAATVVHAGHGKTQLGYWSGANKQAVAAWVARLTAAGLEAEGVEAIRPLLWHKLAVNAVINPLTAIHRVENGALTGRDFKPQVKAMLDEISQVFQRLGIPEPAGGLAERVEQVMLATAANRSSMLQDVLAGRPTEVDYILGSLLKAAKPLGLQLKQSQALYEQVKAVESQQ